MKKATLVIAAMLVAAPALAQTTITTTTGVGSENVVVEPAVRTKIRSYVTEKKVKPVQLKERVTIGATLPADVELEAVPADWGPTYTRYRYVYSGNDVLLVDPSSRRVVQVVE